MQRWAKRAKLPQCSAHGPGKVFAYRLAEAADLERMTDSAIDKLMARPTSERNSKTSYR